MRSARRYMASSDSAWALVRPRCQTTEQYSSNNLFILAHSLPIVTSSEVSKPLHRYKSCCTDIIPTSFILKRHESFSEVIILPTSPSRRANFPIVLRLRLSARFWNTLLWTTLCLLTTDVYLTWILYASSLNDYFYRTSNLTSWHHQITIDINLRTGLDTPLRRLWYSCLTASTTLLAMAPFPLDLSAAFDIIDHPINRAPGLY